MWHSLKEIIAAIPEEELRSLLHELAVKDTALQNRIRMKYSHVGAKEIKRIVGREISALVSSCSDDYDYISYHKAMDFETGLENIMEEYIDPLLSNKAAAWDVISLIGMVFETIADVDIDDDGETVELLYGCTDRWGTVLEYAGIEQREQFAEWIEEHLKGIHYTFPQEELFDFYTRNFPERSFAGKRLENLDKRVRQALTLLEEFEKKRSMLDKKAPTKQIRELKEACESQYNEYEHLVSECCLLMSQFGKSQDEMEQFLLSHPRSERAQDKLLELYKNNRKYDSAIQLTQRRREQAASKWKNVIWYGRELIELYRAAGYTDRYTEELRTYVHDSYQYDLEYIKLLREVLSKSEWIKERDELLGLKNISDFAKAQIYSEDGMLDDLMALIESSDDYNLLHAYEHELFDKYADRLLPLRLREINGVVQNSADRKTYAYLADLLMHLRIYPKGEQIALGLITEWKGKYRRPAMFDELRKNGFR